MKCSRFALFIQHLTSTLSLSAPLGAVVENEEANISSVKATMTKQ